MPVERFSSGCESMLQAVRKQNAETTPTASRKKEKASLNSSCRMLPGLRRNSSDESAATLMAATRSAVRKAMNASRKNLTLVRVENISATHDSPRESTKAPPSITRTAIRSTPRNRKAKTMKGVNAE